MNWALTHIKGHDVISHEGGTGGFSSIVALEPTRQRAVVILADTALADLGGMSDIAFTLLGIDVPVSTPRIAQVIPAELLAAMQGNYDLAGLHLRIWDQDGHLMGQADGQPVFELFFDDHGDFYPEKVNARLTPVLVDGKIERFAWRQGGGLLEGVRQGSQRPRSATNALWKDWIGEYQLTPQFILSVFEEDGRLKLQGTAQPPINADIVGQDRIEVKAVGAILQFNRNDKGEVISATLSQNGQVLEGKKK
jgi:hypothetical protein